MENQSSSPKPNNLDQNSEHPNDGISPKPNNLKQSPEDIIDLEIRKLRARIKKAFIIFEKQTRLPWLLLFSKQYLALSLKNQKKGPGTDVESLQKVKILEKKEPTPWMVSISAFEKSSILWQAFKTIDENTRKAIRKINSESRNLDHKAILNVKKIASLELRKSITKKVFFIKPIDNEGFLFCKIEKAGEEMLRAGKGYVHKTKWKLVEACFYWLFFNKRDPLGKSVPLKNLSFIKMVAGVNNWLSPKSADSTRPDILITWNDSYPKEIKTYEARLGWNLFLDEKIIIKFKIPKNKGSKSQKLVRFKLNEDLISDGVIKERLKELTAKLKERVT